ncbi:hypothetical protein [Robertkochia aurantiaca]|uniref:hypothetical protein n=1 Tax=Robertkochia aurantiaca TaxID=2873700 RepID=UPI001CCE4954|nr:hypothetical protein [Robertkochia sp. 3YJGBD-33]
MDCKKAWESTKTFVLNVPATLRKTSVWMIISYIIPIINVLIIYGIRGDNFSLDLNIINIVLVTNACFITSLVYLINNNREITKALNIVTLIIVVVLFSFSIAQIEKQTPIFSLDIYKSGAIATFCLSILFGLISKYDEVEAESKARANRGKETKETTIGGKSIKL